MRFSRSHLAIGAMVGPLALSVAACDNNLDDNGGHDSNRGVGDHDWGAGRRLQRAEALHLFAI